MATGSFSDIDHIDCAVRAETLRVRGGPVILQLPIVPSYALTIHKTQALSIKHVVRGCLEGVFAFGQVCPDCGVSFAHYYVRVHEASC